MVDDTLLSVYRIARPCIRRLSPANFDQTQVRFQGSVFPANGSPIPKSTDLSPLSARSVFISLHEDSLPCPALAPALALALHSPVYCETTLSGCYHQRPRHRASWIVGP